MNSSKDCNKVMSITRSVLMVQVVIHLSHQNSAFLSILLNTFCCCKFTENELIGNCKLIKNLSNFKKNIVHFLIRTSILKFRLAILNFSNTEAGLCFFLLKHCGLNSAQGQCSGPIYQ